MKIFWPGNTHYQDHKDNHCRWTTSWRIYEGNVSNAAWTDTASIPFEGDTGDDLHCVMRTSWTGDVEEENEEDDVEMDKRISDIGAEDASVNHGMAVTILTQIT